MSNQNPQVDPTRVMPSGGPVADRTLVAPAGVGATQQVPAGGGVADLYRTQVGAVSTCPACKSTTPLPEMYCGDCGFLLSATPNEPIETPVEETPPAELVDAVNGRRYRLHLGINTVGRQGTDVLLNDGTISRVHARIVVEGSSVIVEDLGSSNGTKVGDKRIGPNQPTPAAHGVAVKFGNWIAMLEINGVVAGSGDKTIVVPADDRAMVQGAAAPAASSPLPVGDAVAVFKKTEGPGNDIPIYDGTISIGRRATNTIALPNDAYISGRHVEVVTDNTGTYLTDLGSTNGTVVNGQRLEPNARQLLLDGDSIELGQTKYLFTIVELEMEASSQEVADSVEKQEAEMPEPVEAGGETPQPGNSGSDGEQTEVA